MVSYFCQLCKVHFWDIYDIFRELRKEYFIYCHVSRPYIISNLIQQLSAVSFDVFYKIIIIWQYLLFGWRIVDLSDAEVGGIRENLFSTMLLMAYLIESPGHQQPCHGRFPVFYKETFQLLASFQSCGMKENAQTSYILFPPNNSP